MEWYHYLAVFFSGAFFCNAVPHFVQGVCGNKFPTPFAKPMGIGLSSATINVLWGLFNMVVGYLLFTVVPIDRAHPISLLAWFAGLSIMGIMSSINFSKKHKE